MYGNELDSIDTVHFVSLLREKIDKLILLNSKLTEKVGQLESSLRESKAEVASLRAKHNLAESNKVNPKLVSSIRNSLGDKQATKMRLHQMVQEVEKCIEILEFREDR